MTRREMLKNCAAGFGNLALLSLLTEQGGTTNEIVQPSASRIPHFAPKAKRIIFLFMFGGPSAHDLFLHKPLLERDHGKPNPIPEPRIVFARTGQLMKSPWQVKQHGQSGAWVGELLPEIASVADDLCFLKGMHGTNPEHGAAALMTHTGSSQFVRPSMGSWVSYGLGTENQNLPSFITICPNIGGGASQNYSSAFLPTAHHGTPLGTPQMDNVAEAQFPFLDNPKISRSVQEQQLELLQKWQRSQLEQAGPNQLLEGRIKAFELAFRMQTEAPSVVDISSESQATRKLYGLDDKPTRNFGLRCLLARRFIERGVRFVELTMVGTDGMGQAANPWDQHTKLEEGHTANAMTVDQPVAGLVKDLKSRGLLDETLVIFSGEFGRTPFVQGTNGRDHNPYGFSLWLAGGGLKKGFIYGQTDEYGYRVVENAHTVRDLHATVLTLLGLDYQNLTYRFGGRDFRLADVDGHPIRGILA